MFFYVLYKRTRHSFTFFIKECKRTPNSFWFHKSYKNDKSCKKNVKECSVLFIRLIMNLTFFFQYIFILIYLYISIYLYLSVYIYSKKRTRVRHAFFSKERNVLRSFAKKRCIILCSLQKNGAFFMFFAKERCVF